LDWRCFGNFTVKLVVGVAVGQFCRILFFLWNGCLCYNCLSVKPSGNYAE
jgi:hypothetical protein